MPEKDKSKNSKNDQPDSGVFVAFNKIISFARDLNTQLHTPEVVFIGRQGHGKTSLIETVLGHPFCVVGSEKGGCTKRPIYINLINNLDCSEPKITLKRDGQIKEFPTDKVVDIDDLEAEIKKRNIISSTPIHINYEFKWCWNITLIDTPGLVAPNEKSSGDIGPEEIEEMVLDIAKPSHRILVCVEEVKDGSQSEMISLAKKVDPRLDRTIFVFNKFSEQLKGFTSTRELNRYLTSTAFPDAQYFFTTLPSLADRDKYPGKDRFKERLEELQQEDLNGLEQLQYDKRYANAIGVLQFKKHILELTWSKYQASIPELLKRLRAFRKKSEDSLQHISSQISSLDSNKLRGNAARYVMQFLRNVEKLLVGTLEGNPAINGQTTEEEKLQDETGDWKTYDSSSIKFDPLEWKVPHATSKLYGGQQFERLLAEFKVVTEKIQMDSLTADEIATAAGPQKLANPSICTWAASDICQRHIRKALLPLIDQLFKRASYIMKRLVYVVDSMMEANRRAKRRSGKQEPQDELENYPFFTHAVKDFYYKFIDETAANCKKKCVDEFLSTRLIYWELTNLSSEGKSLAFGPKGSKDDVIKSISNLALELFNKIKARIAKNVLLKSYNFFLVPMQTDLWGEIQGNITCMSDAELEELFEVTIAKEKLADAEKDMNLILDKFSDQEDLFMEYANSFSKGPSRFDL